tara:strand:- start:2713 stop:3480 length:768 start_codon:yes stop_codon:yes gene_type:complete
MVGGTFVAGGMAAAMPAALIATTGSAPPDALFKCTEFVRRAPGLAPEAFLEHWQRHRAPLVRLLPGLVGLTFNLIDSDRSPDAPYDGVIELWFADAAAYGAAVNGAAPELVEALATDRPAFIQNDFLGLFSHEAIIRPASPQSGKQRVKRIGLVGRQPGMNRQQFFEDWVHEHAPQANRQPGLEGYILNLVAGDRFLDSPWDGYAELWWTDAQAFDEASRAIRATVGRRLGFFHSHLLLYLREYEELVPARAGSV